MNHEALTRMERTGTPEPTAEPRQPANESSDRTLAHTIAIAATFTADPLLAPLRFWMDELEITADVVLAPYAQVMQELLNPASVMSGNVGGFDVLVIRLHDWIRDRLHESTERNLQHLRTAAADLATAVERLRARTSAAILVYLCPPPMSAGDALAHPLAAIEEDLATHLNSLPNTCCWTHADLVRLYPVSQHEDARADRVGHIPYTQEYFAAIGTLLARRIAALVKPPYKVIAVDCDNTLWQGICGEDGPAGVRLTHAHLEFQSMLVRQHDAGVLLCLCSKNNADDVRDVFRGRSDMVLREEHLVASCVNWSSKSSSLESLAQELDLSLDAFVFVDDSAMECAEVQTHCPGVLVLQLPQAAHDVVHFLDHVWAFDRLAVTGEARQRTQQYRQNRARQLAREQATDLQQFLTSLQLEVDVAAMRSEQLSRVAELVQRTNQFNLTGMRRKAADLAAAIEGGELHCLVVHARDRFGDYGLVGAILFAHHRTGLQVDTFVLSCRILGRGVEHRIVNELGKAAREQGMTHVLLKCRHTARNAPARAFLEQSFVQFREYDGGGESSFVVPVDYAEHVSAIVSMAAAPANETTARRRSTELESARGRWHEAAYRLSKVPDIMRAIGRNSRRAQVRRGEYIAPHTATEQAVAEIWAEVLGQVEIGARDDFLNLGGDSLSAVQVIARIGSVLGLELSIQDFFEAPTVEQIAGKLARASDAPEPIARMAADGNPPLSSAQLRLWFIDRLEGDTAAYHVPLSLRLHGDLQQAVLQTALDHLVARHEVLRTTFVDADGVPRQCVAPAGRFALSVVDLTVVPQGEREAAVAAHADEEVAARFDLTIGPLIRGRLLRLTEREHVLLITLHHIVSDGWSVGVLVKELSALYDAGTAGRADPLPPLPIQYADYARWQQAQVADWTVQEHVQFWVDHLRGAPPLLEVPADRPRPALQSYRGASVPVALGAALTEEVVALARRHGLTVAMTLHAVWSILLSRLSGQTDITVGVPVANRRRIELEGLIGFFANTLALRLTFDDDPSAEQALARTRDLMLQAYARQDAPFELVVDALQPQRSLSYSPVFQTMFAFQNAPRGQPELAGLTVTVQDAPSVAAQFDLLLSLERDADDIRGALNYATDLFDRATVERWVDCFRCLLGAVARTPHLQVSKVSIMDGAARRRVVEELNATDVPYMREKLIHQLFEEQVQQIPDAVAASFEGQILSYAELNVRANRLAGFLQAQGIGPDELVAVCVERSLEMVVALLGVLKAAGAYVPLDPGYPQERLEYMLRNAGARVVLTQSSLKSKLASTGATIVSLDEGPQLDTAWSGDNPDPAKSGLRSSHLAYVIYTSGSTGLPKGAMNEHRALINRLQWMQAEYHLGADDVVLQKTPFSFDVSVWEFFWTLMSGARLVVARPQGHQDPDYLRALIEQTEVTVLHFVPSMLQIFLERLQPGQCPSLRRVVCSGEELPASLQRQFFQRLPHARLCNLYGPTEAAVDVTFWECLREDTSGRVPIGRPISNLRMYVLDAHRQPLPLGVVGELYIAGAGVGRGYLHRPELTAERFVADPFAGDAAARMYRTGDVGRWRADGAIEYLGRNDHQVKIRGCRIELGEIEAQLLRHEGVREAVVIAGDDGNGEKALIAYIVAHDAPTVVDAVVLRGWLEKTLPDYMVPSAYVTLPAMPLSPNGKLDRRALPAPGPDAYGSREYQPPRGDMEAMLAGMWQSLLRIERVGREDSFFSLGGTSLSAMQLQARMQSALSIDVPIRLLFEAPTLKDLARRLQHVRRQQLLGRVAAMRPHEVRRLLRELTTMEGKP